MTEKHVKDLCTKKNKCDQGDETEGKRKKPFDASLVLKDDGSNGFEFAKKTFAKSKQN
nr:MULTISPECIES: hypothetical protein [Peribacillus]